MFTRVTIGARVRQRLTAKLITRTSPVRKRITAADGELRELITATGSTPPELFEINPSSAEISRFADKGRFSSWNGTAPLDASSGDQRCHRLSRPVTEEHRRSRSSDE